MWRRGSKIGASRRLARTYSLWCYLASLHLPSLRCAAAVEQSVAICRFRLVHRRGAALVVALVIPPPIGDIVEGAGFATLILSLGCAYRLHRWEAVRE